MECIGFGLQDLTIEPKRLGLLKLFSRGFLRQVPSLLPRFIEEGELVKKEQKMIKKVQEKVPPVPQPSSFELDIGHKSSLNYLRSLHEA